VEVATKIHGRALATIELFQNLFGVNFQRLSQGGKRCVGLSKSLCPVESQEEVGSTVVRLIDSTFGSLVFVKPFADRLVESFTEKSSLGVASFT